MLKPSELLKNTLGLLNTPGNIITAVILFCGAVATVMRFGWGIGAVTNLDDYYPWGLWIGFDLLCGVALAAGGFTLAAGYYIFGFNNLRSMWRPALTTAFFGYAFVIADLLYDVGQPWRLPYPVFVSQGTTSLLFTVGVCEFFYLCVMAVLWFVIPCEWLGWKKLRAMLMKLIMPLVALGIILSTLHQSSLGGLYVMVPSKMHPLWYSSWLPVYFFVSSLYAGLSMVIFEGTLAHAGMHKYMDENHARSFDGVSLSLARGASLVMMGYFVIKIGGLTLDNGWKHVFSGYGLLWLLEMALVIVPAFMFAVGVRERRYGMIRLAAGLSVFGVMLNRMDVSLVAYNYNLPTHLKYFPSLGEITLSLFMLVGLVTVYRFACAKMPVLRDHPDYKPEA